MVALLLNIRTKDDRTSAMNLGSLLLVLELMAQIFEALFLIGGGCEKFSGDIQVWDRATS